MAKQALNTQLPHSSPTTKGALWGFGPGSDTGPSLVGSSDFSLKKKNDMVVTHWVWLDFHFVMGSGLCEPAVIFIFIFPRLPYLSPFHLLTSSPCESITQSPLSSSDNDQLIVVPRPGFPSGLP